MESMAGDNLNTDDNDCGAVMMVGIWQGQQGISSVFLAKMVIIIVIILVAVKIMI